MRACPTFSPQSVESGHRRGCRWCEGGGDDYIETVWGRGYVLRDVDGDTGTTEVAAVA